MFSTLTILATLATNLGKFYNFYNLVIWQFNNFGNLAIWEPDNFSD